MPLEVRDNRRQSSPNASPVEPEPAALGAGEGATAGRWTIRLDASSARLIQVEVGTLAACLVLARGASRSQELVHDLAELLEDVQGTEAQLASRGLPASLRQCIGALLDWKPELPDVVGALVFFHSVDAPAFAHVGGEDPDVRAGESRLSPSTFTLRGPHGDQARALSIRPGRQDHISLVWSTGSSEPVGATVTAEWHRSSGTDREPVDEVEQLPGRTLDLTPATKSTDRPIDPPPVSARPAIEQEPPARPVEQEVPPSAASDATQAVTSTTNRQETPPAPSQPGASGRPERRRKRRKRRDLARYKLEPFPAVRPSGGPPAPPAPAKSWGAPPPARSAGAPAPAKSAGSPVPPAPISIGAPSPPPAAAERQPAPASPVVSAPRPRRFEPEHQPGRATPKPRSFPEFEPKPRRSILGYVIGAVGVAILFGIGWRVGSYPAPNMSPTGSKSGAPTLMQAVGWSGSRFVCSVESEPDGAAIRVDGKAVAGTTPTTVSLVPGEHSITLSLGKWGDKTVSVHGKRREKVKIDALLWGEIHVRRPVGGVPVTVRLDGQPRGAAPVTLDHIEPGPHELLLSAPGIEPLTRTVEVKVDRTTEVAPPDLRAARDGEIAITAVDVGSENAPLKGARVWIDGVARGATPLKLNLPSGPHSVRAKYGREEAPVQVINLPGGNKRFVRFEFGSGEDRPRFTLVTVAPPGPAGGAVNVMAKISDIRARECTEMWFHVQTARGTWTRYPMKPSDDYGGVVGVTSFALPVDPGRTRYYVSAQISAGDEFFTDIRTLAEARSGARGSKGQMDRSPMTATSSPE